MKKYQLLMAGAAALAMMTSYTFARETVTFWQFSTIEGDIAAWNDAIKAFEAANPDIDINMEIVPWASQQQRLVSALTTGGLPDVSMLGNNVVAQFQAAGALVPLDPYMEAYDKANGTDVASQVWPGDKGYYFLQGKWWGAPVNVETRALFYRKDLFQAAGLDPDKPPQTWEELAKDAKILTEKAPKGTYGVGLNMGISYDTIHNFMSVWLGYGARMLDDKGKCAFRSPEFEDALTVFTGMFKDGSTHPDAATMADDTVRRGFLDGNYAMILQAPVLVRDIKTENPPWAKDVGIALVPAGPAGRAGFLGGWPLVLWSASEHKEAAAKWIMFATHDGLKQLATAGGFIPGNIQLAQEAPWDQAPYPLFVKQLYDAKPYQYPSEAIPEMGQLEVNAVQTAVQAVALGKQTANEAAADLCTTIDEVLAR